MSDESRSQQEIDRTNRARYAAAIHGVQSAIAYEIAREGEAFAGASPKHLRTGVNSAMVTDAGLASLLMAKGVITEHEYLAAVADEAENELARFCARYPGVTFA